jgi:hypothetical protein
MKQEISRPEPEGLVQHPLLLGFSAVAAVAAGSAYVVFAILM